MRCFKNIFILLLCSVTTFCFAQNHNRERMWVLPDSVGINFNTVTPTIFFSNESGCLSFGDGNPLEADASISDTNGNLLFYSNGWKVYDRNNNLMPNGDSIWCGISTSNGILTLPWPSRDSLYFLFYVNPYGLNNSAIGVYYSVVNMNLNGGNGAIENNMKNVKAYGVDSLYEQIAAIKHGNGRDWWLIGKRASGYFKILVNPEGIYDTSIQQIGLGLSEGITVGEISVSKKGDKIASCLNALGILEVLNFDRCNGHLSNFIFHDFLASFSNPISIYGCCFSPDGNNLYCTSSDTLFQLRINGANLNITYKVICPSNIFSDIFAQLELAPNNIIYLTMCHGSAPSNNYSIYNMNLSTINSPDSIGASCDVQLNSFNLGGKKTWLGLPNMPNYDLGRLVDSPCDTLYNSVNEKITNEKSIVRIYPNPATNELTIEILNGIAPKKIEISNSLGVTVMQLHQTKPTAQLNIRQLAAGVYFVKVKMQDGSVTVRKFMKL